MTSPSALAQLSATWRKYAETAIGGDELNQCANDLDACRGSLVEALQQIEADMREIIRDGDGNISKHTAERWADRLADLRSRIGA